MFLAIDIGNTAINIAIFKSSEIVYRLSFDTSKIKDYTFCKTKLQNLAEEFNITSCGIISVVNNADKQIKPICDEVFKIQSVILTVKSATDITIDNANPECVGMDRLANVYAVLEHKLPAIVIDIGTAITFDILSAEHKFIGGLIMPGLNMELKALANGTSKLPEIKIKEIENVIGNTTETCILSGVICGTASAIDGLITKCIKELNGCQTIVLTGGQAELISKYMDYPYTCLNKDLTMFGIKKIYDSMK